MNHEHFSTSDRLDQATAALRQTPIADTALPEFILRAERIPFAEGRKNTHRAGLIAAAIVIFCVGGAIFFLMQRTASIAFAEVMQSVDQTHTFTASLDVDAPDSPLHNAKCFVRDKDIRIETATYMQIINHKMEQRLILDIPKRLAGISHDVPDVKYDLYEIIRNCEAGSAQPLREKIIDGRALQGFRTKSVEMPGETDVFWVDKATKLPVRAEIGPMVMSDLHFDMPLADALFDVTVPAGYTLAKDTREKLHFAGAVIDQQGDPIADVQVTATERNININSRAMTYIGQCATDGSGHFAIECRTSGAKDTPIRLEFSHRDFLYARLEDLRLVSQETRNHLQVRLSPGRSVTGQVIDPSGKPVAGAVIQSISNHVGANDYGNVDVEYEYAKQTETDGEGRFTIHGLPEGKVMLQVRKGGPGLSLLTAQADVKWAASTTQPATLQITAKPLELAAGIEIHELFGMKLVDLDASMRQHLSLTNFDTVLILDPGSGFAKLRIGEIQAGDTFWMVNDARVKNFHEFAQQLLTTCETQQKQGHTDFSVRVVYDFTRPDGGGSNTQYMHLDADDLAELRRIVQP